MLRISWLRSLGFTVIALPIVAGSSQDPTAPAPIASIWYRGVGGAPRESDLAEIRALGFTGVTWPASNAAHIADVERLAVQAGLTVTVRTGAEPLTTATALRPSPTVDVPVGKLAVAEIAPLVWRAVAHGARVVSFDAGVATGTVKD